MKNPMPPEWRTQIARFGLDLFVGVAILLIAACLAAGHFRATRNFTIEGRLTECEQPLNNRCSDVYRVREATGEEHVTGLGGFRPDPAGLVAGASIRKDANSFSYFVNGREVEWTEASHFIAAALIALLLCGSGIFRARRARLRS
jgi:hypothetical protein